MLKLAHMGNVDLYEQIKIALEKEPGILAAYVIGSTILGKTHSESDFDLAVVVNNRREITEEQVYQLIQFLHFPLNLDLSVVDQTSSPIFLYQIISKGKRVYEKNNNEINLFEASILHNYYDTAHIREIYHQALKDKFKYANR